MLSIVQVVFLLALFLARAEEQKLEPCEEYRYGIKTYNGYVYLGYQNYTWEDVIAILPKLNSTDISCRLLRRATFKTRSGKLLGIQLSGFEYLDDIAGHDLLKNMLALSSDLKYIYVILNVVNPAVLEESMFFSNKKLDYISIEMYIQQIAKNTFLHLEKLKTLSLSGCRLTDFNPNELPSSLERLFLQDNRLQTFDLTKPLVNLFFLDLSENFLTRFILDLKDLLPNINTVYLEKNKITDFQAIDNNLNHTLEELTLYDNQIRNIKVYEWILHNTNVTNIIFQDNLPVCDCSSRETLEALYIEKLVYNCTLPVPGDVEIDIGLVRCPTRGVRDRDCVHFTNLFVFGVYTRGTTAVYNCSNAVLPPGNFEYPNGYVSVPSIENLHFYLSGNPDVRVLPTLPIRRFDERFKINIYAENCNLRSPISAEKLPIQNLRHLYLANNSIDEIDVEILEELLEMETHLTLANNPLICDCQHKPMYDMLVKMHHLIDDFDQLTCSNDGLPFADRELCIAWEIYLLYFALVLFTVLTCFLVIYLRYTLEVQVYIYSRGWFPSYFRTESDETKYKYDVFLSYSDKDEDFVLSIIDFLEKQVSPPFKVCHHHRDWVVGERIDVQINTSVEQSRKTVIILSRNFLTSVWINIEFRTALYTMLEEKAPKLVLIIHGDIGPIKELKPEMRTYIKTTTYLASHDKLFWKKLTYSLRRPINIEVTEPAQQEIEMTPLN